MTVTIAAYQYKSFEDYKEVIKLIERHLNLQYFKTYQKHDSTVIKPLCFIAVLESGRPWISSNADKICSSKKEFINLCRQKLDRKFIKPSKPWLKLK